MLTGIVEFPLEEVEKRMAFVRSLLPSLGESLLSFQTDVHINNSLSVSSDLEFMEKTDHHIDDRLSGSILDEFPSDVVQSEVRGKDGGDNEFSWWIDPVDGTRNFIHGIPLFSISVGLTFRDIPVGGIVLCPGLRDLYSAINGQGAYKNGQPVTVSSIDTIERTLIASGLPYHRKDIISELIADISSFVISGTGLRRTGSLVLDMCWVAEGRFDALWERSLNPWDLCAPSVILKEAGGRLSGFNGEPFHIQLPDVVASNSVIHGSMLETLQKARQIEGMN